MVMGAFTPPDWFPPAKIIDAVPNNANPDSKNLANLFMLFS
jgi:hypothetical protein